MTPAPLSRHGPWYSAAPSAVAVPHHTPSVTSLNRFNDGSGFSALRYFAPDPVTALLEVAALHGAYATGFVAAPPVRSWAVFRYDIVAPLTVVDLGDPGIRAGVTTVQELTGDWLGYHHRSLFPFPAHLPLVHSGPLAPTQRLAQDIYTSPSTHGFLAPSVKTPGVANLVLFFARLPVGSVKHTGTRHIAL